MDYNSLKFKPLIIETWLSSKNGYVIYYPFLLSQYTFYTDIINIMSIKMLIVC